MYKDTSKHIAEPTIVQMCLTADPSIRDENEKGLWKWMMVMSHLSLW